MNILIIAPPNGGKGSSSYQVLNAFPQLHPYVCSEHLSSVIKGNHPDGEEMRWFMEEVGGLVPDHIVNKVVFSKLKVMTTHRWLDGYPRTKNQVDAFEAELGLQDLVVIHYRISDAECIRRSEKRRICCCCNRTQIATPDGSCEFTGQPNAQSLRRDDARIEHRLEEYHCITEPIVEYLISKGVPVFNVNAELGTDHIVPQIIRFLKSYLEVPNQNSGIH